MKSFTLLFLFIASLTINAQIIHVPGDYPTVQQGINAALAGDTVIVAEGIYYEQISFLGKPITVASNYILDANPVHIANTILDGSLLRVGYSSVVLFTSGEDTTSIINGFTIRNGKGTYDTTEIAQYIKAGGINIQNAGAKILNNKIINNILNGEDDNLCSIGAGICAIYPSTENWIVVINNTFDNNQCVSSLYDAGGSAIYSSYNTRLENNTFVYNKSVCNGQSKAYAAIGCLSYPNPGNWLIAKGNTIQFNTSDANTGCRGAGLWTFQMNSIISDNVVSDNESTADNATDAWGGGILMDYPASAQISSNDISNNYSSGSGGGLRLTGVGSTQLIIEDNIFNSNNSAKGAAIDSDISDLWIKNNHFESNTSTNEGGALHIIGNTEEDLSLIENNTFVSNFANTSGGAVSAMIANTLFTNNIFIHNEANLNHGGAVYLVKQGTPATFARFINNSFSENKASDGGAVYSWGCNPEFLNNIFWQDSAASGAEISNPTGIVSLAYNDINITNIEGDAVILDGNIFEDPVFCDTTCLKPESDSPCLDNGTDHYVFSETLTAPAYDILGQPRPLNNGFDMGAYEVLIVGTHNHKTDIDLIVCPNPFSNRLYCQYRLDKTSDVSIIVYDLPGRVKASWNKVQVVGEYDTPIDLQRLQKGLYLLEIKINDRSVTKKIIKQ